MSEIDKYLLLQNAPFFTKTFEQEQMLMYLAKLSAGNFLLGVQMLFERRALNWQITQTNAEQYVCREIYHEEQEIFMFKNVC